MSDIITLSAAAGNAAGGAVTYVEDVFSTYLYTGNGTYSPKTGIQLIDNDIALSDANYGASVYLDGSGDYLQFPSSTGFQFGTGDFTVECWAQYDGTSNTGLWQTTSTGNLEGTTSASLAIVWYQDKIYSYINGSGTNTGSSTISPNTWYHIAMCRSSGVTKVFLNGVEIRSVADTRDYTLSQIVIGGYTSTTYLMNGYVSNFRIVKGTAVYTSAFTPPTTALTAVSGTSLLTCQSPEPLVDNSSNAHTITVNGNASAKAFGPFTSDTAGKGGLVWVKSRSAAQGHFLYDTERGTSNFLSTNATSAENTTYSGYGVTSYNSNGFILEGNVLGENANGADLCSWTFAKQEKFFDVVTYVGTGSATTVSHNLGSTPGFMIVKRLDTTSDWICYHRSITGTDYLKLNTTGAATDFSGYWNNTDPTDSVFTVGNHAYINASGATYVAYLFAHNDGDGEFGETGDQDIIKCGSYTGNQNSDGPEINLGFEPQWIMIKGVDSATSWVMVDVMRGIVTGDLDSLLFANGSNAELTGSYDLLEVTPTGFKMRGSVSGTWNNNNEKFIYIAIRRGPMKTATSATEVFDIDNTPYSYGSAPAFRSATVDVMDFSIQKLKTGTSQWYVGDRLRTFKYLNTASDNAEGGNTYAAWDYMNGFNSYTPSSSGYIGYLFRRAPGFFDMLNIPQESGSGFKTVSHNLGVAPELMILKSRLNAGNWIVWHKDFTTSQYILLNGTGATLSSTNIFGDTAPTATSFQVNYSTFALSIRTYMTYLFATVPGVSKVGSVDVTANVPQDVDCGFTTGARFVLVKRTDSTGDWFVWDTERGIVAGNDPYLLLNATNAEVTNADLIDPLSSGFTLNFNATGTWVFLAIA